MWHLTHDMLNMAQDMWQVEGGAHYLKIFSFLAFTACEWSCLEDIFTNHDLLSYSIDHNIVCKTAMATLGLLKSREGKGSYLLVWSWV